MLDRAAFEWATAVAGPSVDADGQPPHAVQFDVVKDYGGGREGGRGSIDTLR